MDTATLLTAHAVLRERSIRGAARTLGRPVSSVAAAFARLEAAISVPLARRAGPSLFLTLEAERLMPELSVLAGYVEAITVVGPRGAPAATVGFTALWRLVQIARTGSIRRTAKTLGLGQPQLTRQVAQVEAALGHRLLDRGIGGCRATEAGAATFARAEAIHEAWSGLTRAAAGRFRRDAATTRLGAIIPLGYESHVAVILASLVDRWSRERPGEALLVSSAMAEELIAGLRAGSLDAVLLDTRTVPADLTRRLVLETPLILVATRAVASRSGAPTPARLLCTAPVALPSPRSGLRQAMDDVIADVLPELDRGRIHLIEVDSIPVILNLVLKHGFVSVLPGASVARVREDLIRMPLGSAARLPLWLVSAADTAGRGAASKVWAMLEALGHVGAGAGLIGPEVGECV